MKKLLFVLIAVCLLAAPVLAADELTGLSEKQLLTVYDALMSEIQKRNIDTSSMNPRDPQYVFGENVHIQTGQLSVCLPTAVPNSQVVLPTVPTATPIPQVGDKASYDSQSPVDGTHVLPGQVFDITWNLLNTGKNRWGLLRDVPPNQVGSGVVDAVAPTAPGTYTMAVVLGNENDENFMVVDITIIVDNR